MRWVIAFVFAIFFSLATFADDQQPNKQRPINSSAKVAYSVTCDDSNAQEKLEQAIAARLKAANLSIVEDPATGLPVAQLLVYAKKDGDNKINKNGWSLAVAYVSNQKSYFVVGKVLSDKNIKLKEEIKSLFIHMLDEQGFLKTMNVVHMDELNDQYIADFANMIVDKFIQRLESYLDPAT